VAIGEIATPQPSQLRLITSGETTPLPRPRRRAPDPTAAAFFDVDNTVVRGASIFHLARGLYARHFFTNRDIARFAMT